MPTTAKPRAAGRVTRLLAAAALALSGCGVAEEGSLPPDVQDPATVRTPSGAVARYRGALDVLPGLLDEFVTRSGILTDELAALPNPQGVDGVFDLLDGRVDPSFGNGRRHHLLRGQAREARGFLAAYAPDSSPALRGHLYALEGYAEVLLADLFCSGIPLSTVDFDGNYTLAPGSTTAGVYRHAVALFDSAGALFDSAAADGRDSVGLRHFGAVARGRALLALAEYADAAASVAGVPDDFVHQVTFTYAFDPTRLFDVAQDSAALPYLAGQLPSRAGVPSVGDREGVNGLDYLSSGDPRIVPVAVPGADVYGNTMYLPSKYPASGPVTFVVASGVEARLIEAEAALHAGGDWLGALNALRRTVGLGDTTDPGTADARVDLLFRERAYWLYLTGHRQGDLRRLIRNAPYFRAPTTVYPVGPRPAGPGASYGDEVVMPTPDDERVLNPKYTGCFHRNA